MLKKLYALGVEYPKTVVLITLVATVFFALQLPKLHWETDARVYLPKGHSAILYDEKVDTIFGVKDTVVVGIVNQDGSIFNAESLARIKRITDKISALQGVQATRAVDVASLSTATIFTGNETEIGTQPVMETVPQTEAEIAAVRKMVFDNADLFVGNIVSADGSSAMIRAKLKEGISNRYEIYFQVKGILAAESGEGWSGGPWGGQSGGGDWKKWQGGKAADTPATAENVVPPTQAAPDSNWKAGGFSQPGAAQQPGGAANSAAGASSSGSGATEQKAASTAPVRDKFYLAGRPVIEVSSGLYAMEDMKLMIPLVLVAMALVLFAIFRTLRGMVLPLVVMGGAIIWTMGAMALFDVPLYTISTMLPVILVAVGIGDAVHLLSSYYDVALQNPHRSSKEIVSEVTQRLGGPLVLTSVTTAIGFLTLLFAEMPPFKVFGLFAVLGVFFSWLISITLLPAILTLLKPKVGNYFARRRAMRVYEEQSRLAWIMTRWGELIHARPRLVLGCFGLIALIMVVGASRLFVNSSWLSDFAKDGEVAVANKVLNEKFSGTVFLHVVVEASEKDAIKDPSLLRKIEALQRHVEKLPNVGDSLSVVDFIKNMNKSLHSGDPKFDVLPESKEQIAEYLFLFSVSGRPQQLDEVVDLDYQKALVSVIIKTDYTQSLKAIIDDVNAFAAKEFAGTNVKVNLAGSANNSYIWADLLIGSQASSILFSKVGIFAIAALMFVSLVAGFYIVLPVTLSTLLVAGAAGFMGVALDVSTALAAGMAIGVGVDYTIHYIFRYIEEYRRSGDARSATTATLRTVGRTIVFNALVVTVGFSALFFSKFPPHAKLGYFVAAYMVVSCVIALGVLPALFATFKPKFLQRRAG